MTISGGSALNKDDIERMTADAEAHAEEDRKRREEAEVRNSAEQLVYQTEKFIKENEDKIPEDAKANVAEPLEALKKSLQGSDVEAIKAAVDKVATASQALGTAMYSASQGAAGADPNFGPGESAGGDEDDIVDAEVIDEDEQK